MLCAELNQSFGSLRFGLTRPCATAMVWALKVSRDAMPIRNTFVVSTPGP
jgi:hypothetical protein